MPSPTPLVFFRASRSFRSPKVIAATVCSAVFAAFFWWLVSLPRGPGTASKNAPTVLACLASFIAVVGLNRAVKGETWELVISTDGVRYGKELWYWNQISTISNSRRSFSSNYSLWIALEGGPIPAAGVPTPFSVLGPQDSIPREGPRLIALLFDEPMSHDACSRLFSVIRPWLGTNYPKVRIKES